MNTNKTQENQESNTFTPKTPLNTKPQHKLNRYVQLYPYLNCM